MYLFMRLCFQLAGNFSHLYEYSRNVFPQILRLGVWEVMKAHKRAPDNDKESHWGVRSFPDWGQNINTCKWILIKWPWQVWSSTHSRTVTESLWKAWQTAAVCAYEGRLKLQRPAAHTGGEEWRSCETWGPWCSMPNSIGFPSMYSEFN